MGILAEEFSSQQERHDDDDQVKQLEQELEHQQHQEEQNRFEQQDKITKNNASLTSGSSEGKDNDDDDGDEKAPSAVDLWGWEYPEKDGLYDPALEKDACGVGFIVSIEGVPSHKVIEHLFSRHIILSHYHISCFSVVSCIIYGL